MNPTTKTTDLEFLKNFTKGDVEKMRRYINMYLNTTPQVIQEIEQFFEENITGPYQGLPAVVLPGIPWGDTAPSGWG